jgi:hypothetical protein
MHVCKPTINLKHNISILDSFRTNKRNFHHMFRITKLVSLARHTHDDHHFVRKGLFSKGTYPRRQEVPIPPKQEATSDPPVCGKVITEPQLEKDATCRLFPHWEGNTKES